MLVCFFFLLLQRILFRIEWTCRRVGVFILSKLVHIATGRLPKKLDGARRGSQFFREKSLGSGYIPGCQRRSQREKAIIRSRHDRFVVCIFLWAVVIGYFLILFPLFLGYFHNYFTLSVHKYYLGSSFWQQKRNIEYSLRGRHWKG